MEKTKRIRRRLDINDIEPCVRTDIIFDSNITPNKIDEFVKKRKISPDEGKRQKLYCKKRVYI
jgi:hypothetical protein